MKIGIIVTSFPVAAQPFILNQVTGLLDAGHAVDVIARCDTRHEMYHADFDDYNLSERTSYIHMPNYILGRLKYLFANLNQLRFAGAVKFLSAINVFRYGTDAVSLRLLVYLVQMHQYEWDVVHVQYGVNGYIGRFLRDAGIAKKFLLQIRGSVFATTSKPADASRILSSADKVLTISGALRNLVIKAGCPQERVEVLYTGLVVDRFPFRKNYQLNADSVRLLSVGRLVPVKGHDVVIRAMATLVKEGHNISYTIVGGGPLGGVLLELAEKLGVSDRLDIVDLIPQHELIEYYHSHDLLVHPSIVLPNKCFEGMGTSITEAMACGLPVIAADNGGMLDTVILGSGKREEGRRGGKTGFLFETGSADALAECISEVLHFDGLNDIRLCAREMIEDMHDCSRQVKALVRVYGELGSGI